MRMVSWYSLLPSPVSMFTWPPRRDSKAVLTPRAWLHGGLCLSDMPMQIPHDVKTMWWVVRHLLLHPTDAEHGAGPGMWVQITSRPDKRPGMFMTSSSGRDVMGVQRCLVPASPLSQTQPFLTSQTLVVCSGSTALVATIFRHDTACSAQVNEAQTWVRQKGQRGLRLALRALITRSLASGARACSTGCPVHSAMMRFRLALWNMISLA